ncbi:MAG: hypothetical protein BAJALOKI2v1_600009 [Promethearchaeota archaeon]|nr:MAG: hypothetical protein BAJALOKI2v1_600009 [Candidatus Lokiarchaeota archaeon]
MKHNNKEDISDLDYEFRLYERIRECLFGIFDILKINFNVDDVYYLTGFDNVNAINALVVELLKINNPAEEIKERLLELELKELYFKENY